MPCVNVIFEVACAGVSGNFHTPLTVRTLWHQAQTQIIRRDFFVYVSVKLMGSFTLP